MTTTPPQYEFHPFANAFPMMTDQERAELVVDIVMNGLHDERTAMPMPAEPQKLAKAKRKT
jgi:hypothetical protein